MDDIKTKSLLKDIIRAVPVFAIVFGFGNFESAWAALPALSSRVKLDFNASMEVAKNAKLPMSKRWQALIDSADAANFNQLQQIKTFAKSKDWYMRNASLVALEKVNINHAVEQAKLLLNDKALVVRSAAVDILANQFTRENRDLLAEELTKPYNFSRKQSLWIRAKIFNLIASRATREDLPFVTRYLFDTDGKIVAASMTTLERLTGVQFDEKNKVQEWRQFVKKSGL